MTAAEHKTGGGKLIVVSGPSGAGKSTIDKLVTQQSDVVFSVSMTTRPPRPGEVDGKDYCFVSPAQFQDMIEHDGFLEYAEVFGEYYGTPREPVEKAIAEGRTVLLEIDVQGGLQVHQAAPEATFVLIVPPSMDILRERLAGRGTENDEALERRLAKAKDELELARGMGAYTYEIVNDNLDEAVRRLLEIVNASKP